MLYTCFSEVHITPSIPDSVAIDLEPGQYILKLWESFTPAIWGLNYNGAYHALTGFYEGGWGSEISFNIDTAQRLYLHINSATETYYAIYNITIEKIEDDVPNRYLYNGKERLPALTDVYDYGFRAYNPGIGRFFSVDPLASKFPQWSPYSFGFNSPIQFNDPIGMEPESGGGNKKSTSEKPAEQKNESNQTETTKNAFIERFNKTYRTEIIDSYAFLDLDEVRELTDKWFIGYNTKRPHQSLDGKTPQQAMDEIFRAGGGMPPPALKDTLLTL